MNRCSAIRARNARSCAADAGTSGEWTLLHPDCMGGLLRLGRLKGWGRLSQFSGANGSARSRTLIACRVGSVSPPQRTAASQSGIVPRGKQKRFTHRSAKDRRLSSSRRRLGRIRGCSVRRRGFSPGAGHSADIRSGPLCRNHRHGRAGHKNHAPRQGGDEGRPRAHGHGPEGGRRDKNGGNPRHFGHKNHPPHRNGNGVSSPQDREGGDDLSTVVFLQPRRPGHQGFPGGYRRRRVAGDR